jgi:cyclopropane-fatty-acyl-phospholipid synthase
MSSTNERLAEATRDQALPVESEILEADVSPTASKAVDRGIARRLLSALGEPPFDFVLWGGERVASQASDKIADLRIGDRAALLGLVKSPDIEFGDGYSEGRIEVDGDLPAFLEALYHGVAHAGLRPSPVRQITQRLRRARSNTLDRSRDNVHHHYDIGNQFYSLWLGETMAYTCAYYPTPDADLDAAQVAKMHHVCRKLRLAPGETVVEAGCGWGMLAMHMARHYGVKVRAFNISREQIAYAREHAAKAGLADRVEYVEDDYRNIAGRYDAFVSVGMLEHVGLDHYRELGRIARDAIGPRGRGLIHSIGRNRPKPLNPWIVKRIFPGAYPPSLREMMEIFEPWNLSVLDVENIRLHYARTLEHWLEKYQAAEDGVRAMFDERFVRMWRLYLAGSIASFRVGELQLFQVVFAQSGNNHIPWTRADLYAS